MFLLVTTFPYFISSSGSQTVFHQYFDKLTNLKYHVLICNLLSVMMSWYFFKSFRDFFFYFCTVTNSAFDFCTVTNSAFD